MARTQVRSTRLLPPSGGSSAARPSAIGAVRDAGSAYSLLHPIRRRILESLREPDSASGLARRLHMPRQVLNYHVKEMARARLLRPAGRRKRRAFFEQCYVASAVGYVLSPQILGELSAKPGAARDRFSATFLMGLASQIQSEVGDAMERAEQEGKRVSIERHTTPYRDAGGKVGEGRAYRLVLGCYPIAEKGNAQREPSSEISI